MEQRYFLKLGFAVTAALAAIMVSAQAAPLTPQSVASPPSAATQQLLAAVTSSAEASQLKAEQVRWHRHWHRPWRRHWHHWHRHW